MRSQGPNSCTATLNCYNFAANSGTGKGIQGLQGGKRPQSRHRASCGRTGKGEEKRDYALQVVKTLPTSNMEEKTPRERKNTTEVRILRAEALCIPYTKGNKTEKSVGIRRRALKLARNLHAYSVEYAHKLVTTRRAIENKTLHSQVLEPGASSNPPDPH
eukprot:1139886-Pelagomonas_calceolata.AAC.3